jgi:hypothetical protein
MTSRHHLSFAEFDTLAQYVRSRSQKLMNERPNLEDLVKDVQTTCGFAVTQANIENVCKVTGVKWKRKRERTGPNKNAGREKLNALRTIVLDICKELDHKIPDHILEALK